MCALLIVSCEPQKPVDEVVDVKVEITNKDDLSNCYWRYTAVKTDSTGFTTGEKREETSFNTSNKLSLSTGEWKINLFGYEDETYTNLLYKGEVAATVTKENFIVSITVTSEYFATGKSGKTYKELKGTIDEEITFAPGNYTFDLNGETLNIKSIELPVSEKTYTVTIKNGTINGSDSIAFILETNSHLVLDNVKVNYEGTAIAFLYQGSNPVWLEVKNSTLTNNGGYGIGTNAKEGTDYVYVTVDNSTVITSTSNQDNTGILFNVPGELKITNNSVISGERQGVIVRGGEAVISNSTIISSGTKTNYYGKNDYVDRFWDTGNEVPLAALVIGNRTANSYKYPTTVTLDNVTLETNEKVVRKAMYVYQENAEYPVVVIGNLSDSSEKTMNTIENDNKATVFPEAKIGNKYYTNFKDAVFAAVNATNESDKVVDVLTNKITVGTHSIEINGSVTINGNGADFYQVDGEQDVSVFTYNNNKGVVSNEQNVNIIINNAKNLRVWGNGSLIADNQKVKITLNDCSWDLSSKGFTSVNNIGMIMLRGSNKKGSYQLEMENCHIKNTEKTDAIHGNIFSQVTINNCTFENIARAVSLSPTLDSTVNISNSTFTNCGVENGVLSEDAAGYAAPIRIVNKGGDDTTVNAEISNVTVTGTKRRDILGDVLLVDSRNGQNWYPLTAEFSGCSELKVKNSASGELLVLKSGVTETVKTN